MKDKALTAAAAAVLKSEKLASALVAVSAADAKAASATQALVQLCLEENRHPNFFLSPCDKQGRPKTQLAKGQCSASQYDALLHCLALGMGNAPRGIAVKTYAELLAVNPTELAEEIKAKRALLKGANTRTKTAVSRQLETLEATKRARSDLKRKLSSKMRDISLALISAYTRQEKITSGVEAANALRDRLKQECGFSVRKDGDSAGADAGAGAGAGGGLKTALTKALHALQESEFPPRNVNALVAELNKALASL